MKDGVRKRTHTLKLDIDNECIDVVLAGIRVKVDYDALSKTFFVGVGMPGDGFQFRGHDGIPIGKMFDALMPLAVGSSDDE
jgi:hypothetical protein